MTVVEDRDFLSRFIDQAVAGRPQGYRREDLQEALRRVSWRPDEEGVVEIAERQHDRLSMLVDQIDKGEEVIVVAQALRAIAAELRVIRIQGG